MYGTWAHWPASPVRLALRLLLFVGLAIAAYAVLALIAGEARADAGDRGRDAGSGRHVQLGDRDRGPLGGTVGAVVGALTDTTTPADPQPPSQDRPTERPSGNGPAQPPSGEPRTQPPVGAPPPAVNASTPPEAPRAERISLLERTTRGTLGDRISLLERTTRTAVGERAPVRTILTAVTSAVALPSGQTAVRDALETATQAVTRTVTQTVTGLLGGVCPPAVSRGSDGLDQSAVPERDPADGGALVPVPDLVPPATATATAIRDPVFGVPATYGPVAPGVAGGFRMAGGATAAAVAVPAGVAGQRGGADPGRDEGHGGTGDRSAQTGATTTSPGQPSTLPGQPPGRPDAYGRLVPPPDSPMRAGRLPGVRPLPG